MAIGSTNAATTARIVSVNSLTFGLKLRQRLRGNDSFSASSSLPGRRQGHKLHKGTRKLSGARLSGVTDVEPEFCVSALSTYIHIREPMQTYNIRMCQRDLERGPGLQHVEQGRMR